MSHNGVSRGEITMYGGCFFGPPLSPAQEHTQAEFVKLLKQGGVAILHGRAGSGLTTILVETFGEIRSESQRPVLLDLTPAKFGLASRTGEASELSRAIGEAMWSSDWVLIDSNREVISDRSLMELIARELERHPEGQKHIALALRASPSLEGSAATLFGDCAFSPMEAPKVEDYIAVLQCCLGQANSSGIDVPRLYEATRGGTSAYALSEMCAAALAWGQFQPSTELLIELSRVHWQLEGTTVALGELRAKIEGRNNNLGKLLRLRSEAQLAAG